MIAPQVSVTLFANKRATTKQEQAFALAELAKRIETTTRPDKSRLPWLKLARFGGIRTDKNSLRHDGNMLAITGIEADYDAEQIDFDDAMEKLTEAGILALIYTSPSHTEDTPRWRVLCPLSQEYPPDQRDRYMARLNGLFGGTFSRESWTLSQSYYYGSVNRNPSHRVVVLGGTRIDQADELDAIAIGRPEKPRPNGNGQHGPHTTRPEDISSKRIATKIDSLLNNVRTASDGNKHLTLRDNGIALGGYLHLTGWTQEQAAKELVAALPASVEDWEQARKTAAWAVAEGAKKPLDLEDRPNPRGTKQTSNSEPPPDWEKQHPPTDKLEAVAALEVITEQAVMREFVARYRDVLRFNHDSKEWLVWSEHYWKPDTRKRAFSWSLDLCRLMATAEPGAGRRVAEKVRFSAAVETGARAMREVATAQEDWDANPWLLGTPGGVVDLRTGELRAGMQGDMITKITACTPATIPDCPLWLGFLDYAMHGDDLRIHFIQRFFGYCLTGLTREEVFLFLFGAAGAGKGTLVETITGIMGNYASTAPMEVFTGQAFRPTEYYRADMAGKRLIAAAEPERGSFWAEAFVKEMTGGDSLSGRHPAGRPFTFKPTHKPLLHGNHMPRLRGRSTGMERRLRILPFDRKADPPDLTLKTKLRDEWPAILRWCIEGALAWQKIGLQPPQAVMAANSRYFDAQDAFGRWIDECCILDPNLQLEPATLRASFNAWAKANGEEELSGNAFAEAIDQFDAAPLRRVPSHGKRWVKGIGLKPPNRPDWASGDGG